MIVRMLIAAAAAAFAAPALALDVFACEPEWAALVKELGGAHVNAYSASTALQDIHKLQARPSLIAKFRQAELVVCTGAELEIAWLPALTEKANNPAVLPGTPGHFEASRHVRMLEIPSSVDRSLGDVHPYGNPHVHMSPLNIEPVAKALAARLAELDGEHAADYEKRYRDFSSRWAQALDQWRQRSMPLKGVLVVSHHKTWPYLYDWLGIDEVATLEPKPAVPPSGAHLEKVLATVKARPVRMVVYSSYEDPRAAEWLSRRTGIPVVRLPYSVGGAKGADDLFGFYDVLIDSLLKAAGRV